MMHWIQSDQQIKENTPTVYKSFTFTMCRRQIILINELNPLLELLYDIQLEHTCLYTSKNTAY